LAHRVRALTDRLNRFVVERHEQRFHSRMHVYPDVWVEFFKQRAHHERLGFGKRACARVLFTRVVIRGFHSPVNLPVPVTIHASAVFPLAKVAFFNQLAPVYVFHGDNFENRRHERFDCLPNGSRGIRVRQMRSVFQAQRERPQQINSNLHRDQLPAVLAVVVQHARFFNLFFCVG
jgi:hypothetical protein